MTLSLPVALAVGYHSASQIARITTEAWAQANLRCPNCGGSLSICAANTKTKDFDCSVCDEHFQLKSCTGSLTGKITGAEYRTAVASITAGMHPSLILLRYAPSSMTVTDVQFIHKACITPSCIIARKPLGPTARRAGWQGCMLDLDRIPMTGRVDVVQAGKFEADQDVHARWEAAGRLLTKPAETRGWTADVLHIVEQLPPQFSLADAYSFEDELSSRHPDNRHIRDKIRQQLQVLRDLGFISFEHHGVYRKVLSPNAA